MKTSGLSMRNVLMLARYQWASYWRRLHKAGGVNAANQGILLLVLLLVVVKYFQLLQIAATNLTRGNTAVLNSLLTGIFVGLLFPLASGVQVRVASRRMLHLPLSHQKLFVVRLLSLLIPPSSWLIVVASLAICYPLASAPNQLAGVIAALLFIVMSWQIGAAASHLLSISIWRKLLALLSLTILLASAIAFRSGVAFSDLDVVTRLSPVSLVVDAALGKRPGLALGELALLAIVASCVAFWSFRQSLEAVATRPRRRNIFGWFRFPGRLGGLIAKDFRYFRRLLDTYLGLLTAALCCVHLLVAEAPSADVVRIFNLVIFLANSAVAFNLFGLDDRAGMERYTLLPLTGQATLLSKNFAFVLVVGVQLVPIFVFTVLRLGIWETAGGIVQSISLAAAYLAWGNWMSLSHPLKLQFFRFSSSSSALADIIGGLIFGSLPGVVAIYELRDRARFPWLVLLATLFSVAIYALSLIHFGKRFEQRRENVAAALT